MNTLLDYFASYNKRIFPLQVAMAILAIGVVGLMFILPSMTTTILLNVFLCVTFVWIGVAFLFSFHPIVDGSHWSYKSRRCRLRRRANT
jgi:hypothetical protein